MESDPPSIVPTSSAPPLPGTAAYRSSSAPTTSIAPPAVAPGLFWPVLRTLLAGSLLALRAALSTNDATAFTAMADAVTCCGVALLIGALPMLLPRYRSFASFSWRVLAVTFIEFYASYSRSLG